MIKYIRMIGIGIILLCITGCTSKVLRYKDIAHPVISYERDGLMLKGALIHSSLGVKNTSLEEKNDALYIKSYLDMSHANTYLLYSVYIDVPEHVDEVRFGKEETLKRIDTLVTAF